MAGKRSGREYKGIEATLVEGVSGWFQRGTNNYKEDTRIIVGGGNYHNNSGANPNNNNNIHAHNANFSDSCESVTTSPR